MSLFNSLELPVVYRNPHQLRHYLQTAPTPASSLLEKVLHDPLTF